MTIGSPRRFFSNSRGRVIGRREASAGVWMFGCALMATQPPGCPLALRMRVVDETGAAHAGGDGDEHLAVDARDGARGRPGGRARGSRARRRARAWRPARPRAGPRRRARRRPATPRRRPARRAARARARGRRPAGGRCGWRGPGRRARARWGSTSMRTGRSRSRTRRADDERLLRVLLAEEGHVGPDHVQQLGHDGGDAVEVAHAAVLALERLGQAAHVDRGREARRVDLVERRARRARRRRPRPRARRRAPRRAGRRPGRRPR